MDRPRYYAVTLCEKSVLLKADSEASVIFWAKPSGNMLELPGGKHSNIGTVYKH
jgi:hypothetical protein